MEEAEEIRPGDEDGVGTVSRLVWKSLLPYRVEFEVTTTRVEQPHLLEADAVGELDGVGRWRLYEQDGVTAVLYEWNVSTTKPWMNLLAPVAAPRLRVEPRLGDGARRRGDRPAARLPPAGERAAAADQRAELAICSLSCRPLALSCTECQTSSSNF